MMKQALFAAASLAVLAGPVASHAQMQAMDNAGLRDVAGQGLSLPTITSVSYGKTVSVLGYPVYGASYEGGILAPKTLSVGTPSWDFTIHADKFFTP
jgi:uncharacterized protein YaaW (UPF0174 family)